MTSVPFQQILRPEARRGSRWTLHTDSPGGALFIQKLGSCTLASPLARQCLVQGCVTGCTERGNTTSRQCKQSRWHGVISLSASRRRELGNDLTTVRHQQALTGSDFPEIFAQAIL